MHTGQILVNINLPVKIFSPKLPTLSIAQGSTMQAPTQNQYIQKPVDHTYNILHGILPCRDIKQGAQF